MTPLVIGLIGVAVAVVGTALMNLPRLRRSGAWHATVTPLASIIGSGFLVSGPLLAREFGMYAAPAMALLLALAYAVGGVMRFNIAHAEPYLAAARLHDPVAWFARIAQGVLAAAYAVSVAYYLKLLAAFALRTVTPDPLWADLLVSAIIGALVLLAWRGDIVRVEQVAEKSVGLKLGVIAGLVVGLALYWITCDTPTTTVPTPPLGLSKIPLLLGLLIVVQGFETSRYLGASYDAPTRIRTMRLAQLIATGIYLGFLVLLTPVLGAAARSEGVAGILDVMNGIAPLLGVMVLVAAAASQLSAAIADSLGSAGLSLELSGNRLTLKTAYVLTGALALGVVWLTDPFEVIAVASRAFGLFYALQCVLAIWIGRRTRVSSVPQAAFQALIACLCLAAAAAGAPAG